ncbi:hypothetical protein Deipr_1951 [Deinococcus proteolyticus MRP]|uniref:Lipoprotein n=1 Tax=Deinococcus proteolyticus (strain ATCC 35074 / DSM 20540 / JCM 6276 / NBRC 101906 / NCIMB 13154 / VKM Ac-1939 / CCM 2703 / MRP) TaxID=693977 RepID=F0RME5_DEIPM|nr:MULTISPECIES: hypothetical protein [Deinococcus]ADY27082.1 hypothetical protein Deipr_1951 [Deinococcus proteolyticus MRP]MCY1703206.1 hypothetical protein [Deinococcus sp. SL84]
MNRLLFPAALGLTLTACTPAITAPDLSGSPLAAGQEWLMLTPAEVGSPGAAGPVQLSRQLTVGPRELLADGTVAYTAEPRSTTTGRSQDLFRFVPRGEGRSVIVAGRAETTFDLRFFDFCVVRSSAAEVNQAQTGVYVQTASLDSLWTNRTYQAYVGTGVAAGLKPCTLTRVK